jgi:hypothetical protein
MMKSRRQRGSSLLEFTLVGIPLMFTLISIEEMSRGAWLYHSQAYAVNEGTRYVVVRGADCALNGNTCSVTVGNVATQIANAGVGLVPSQWNVTLYSASGSVSCHPLSNCTSNSTIWPPTGDNAIGQGVAVAATYPFNSALGMFFPGTQPTKFAAFNLPAYSQQLIQF